MGDRAGRAAQANERWMRRFEVGFEGGLHLSGQRRSYGTRRAPRRKPRRETRSPTRTWSSTSLAVKGAETCRGGCTHGRRGGGGATEMGPALSSLWMVSYRGGRARPECIPNHACARKRSHGSCAAAAGLWPTRGSHMRAQARGVGWVGRTARRSEPRLVSLATAAGQGQRPSAKAAIAFRGWEN